MTPQPFEARVVPGKMLLLAMGGLAMGALSAWVAVTVPFDLRPIPVAAGWAGVIFFPLCSLVAVRQLFRSGPVMEIGPGGVLWRRWSDTRIPWSAFARARVVQVRSQKTLSMWFRDPGAYPSTGMLGRLPGLQRAMGFGEFVLSAQGLDRSFDEMAGAVREYAPHLFD